MAMMAKDHRTKYQLALEIVSGGGVLGELVRNKDWSKTALGAIETWPQSLLTAVSMVLASRFPMIMFWGPELTLIYNDAYIPIFGMKHPNILGKTGGEAWSEIWHILQPMVQQVVETGNPTWSDDQFLILTRNNYQEETYFTWSYSAIRDETGKISGVLTPITETTTRVLSERRLKLLRDLGNKTSRAKNDFEACNETVEALTNHPDLPFTLIYLASSPEAKSWDLISHSGLSSPQAAAFPPIIQLPKTTPYGERRRSWDNETNQLLYRVFSDVTSKRTLVEIQHPSSYFGHLPGGKWPVSPTIAYAVPIPSDQNTISGVIIVGINPCRSFDDDYKGFVELLAGQIGRSISSARAYEAERKRAEALAEIDNAKTVFFSNVSHEFRTPLTLIKAPLEDLLVTPQSHGQKDKLQLIQRNALRLEKLVNSLLDFSRIEAGRSKGVFEKVDLTARTADVASMFRSAFQKARLDFDIQCQPLSKSAYVDVNMWEKIVLNLLSNSFKYTMKGGVKLTLHQDDDSAVLTVMDTGIGISETELPRIFDRFHRVEGSRGRSHEGTGIGLALLQELVKIHGGQVRVFSKGLGEGSTFEVRIPLGSSHLPPDQISGESYATGGSNVGTAYLEEALRWLPSSSSGSSSSSEDGEVVVRRGDGDCRYRILLADDNSDMREYVTSLLRGFWEIEQVGNGLEAIQAARARKPDLILSDVMMPVMDGFQLIEMLKADHMLSSVPVILLSARAGDEAKVEGLRAGADDYLVKPFSGKELIARVNTHIGIGRMRDELERKVRERTEELRKINANLESEIQQRREIEKALAESEEHYRTLTAISPVGIFHTDIFGVPTYVNHYWTDLTGLSINQLQGSFWYEKIVHPKDLSVVAALFAKVQTDEHQFSSEFRLLLPGNKKVCVLGQLISQRSKLGEVVGYIGTITDLTEQKKLEKERLKATKELAQQKTRAEEAEYYRRQQEQFIDMVCHEIRNPLTGVDGNADLMKDTLQVINNWLDANQHIDRVPVPTIMKHLRKEVSKLIDSVDNISECVEHQKLIVNDVLDLSKLEANKIELNVQPFSAIDTLASVKKMFDTQASKKHISLEVKVPSEEVIIRGDYARVAQILINLVSNAIKFTHTGGVTLELQIEERSLSHTKIRFIVSDTGVGLSPEEKAKIFQRFSQASRTTFAEYGGSGLGLFISKNLARLMEGDILVESEKWKGAKFIAVMKCENPSEAEIKKLLQRKNVAFTTKPQSSPGESIQEPEQSLRILIVEDNRINQQLLSKYFQQSQYSHSIANNGLEALNLVEKSMKDANDHIDLILMDIEMPVMNGYEATTAIRKLEAPLNRHVPIIGLSGNARCSQIQKALTVGMDDYITKPFKRDEIFQKIKEHLEAEVSYAPNVLAAASANSQNGNADDHANGFEPNAKRTKLT